MIPILLDLLTVVFVVAGGVLLWLNLRQWRRSGVGIAPENYAGSDDHQDRAAEQPRQAESLEPWSTPFDDPIDLPGGQKLITLWDAATYITKLPKAEQQAEEWRTAARCLIDAAEHRDFLVQAHIDVLRALNRHV